MSMTPPSPSADDSNNIEVSVVRSPEVFGAERNSPGQSNDADEQSIEKKDQSPQNSVDVTIMDVGEVNLEPNSVHDQLKLWQWVTIDGIQLPALIRGHDLYLAVHNVQLRLLSRFPPGLSKEILNRYMMVSHRMTAMEAWTLNLINTVIKKCELGCLLFTNDDEIVNLYDVERFYWNIKAINLSLMIQKYDEEIKRSHENISLMAVITGLKQQLELELEECKVQINRLGASNDSEPSAITTRSSPMPMSTENINVDSKVDCNVYS